MITSVRRAFSHSGFLNAVTPLEIASTPVTAVPLDREGMQHRREARAVEQPVRRAALLAGLDHPVHRVDGAEVAADELRRRRRSDMTPMIPMKKYVGTANTFPDSRTPLRFMNAINAMKNNEIGTAYGLNTGNAEIERRGARGRRHGDGEHVVGQQRDSGHLRRQEAEVVARHHVRATGRRVLLDRLPVGEDQEEEDAEHRDGDADDEAERGDADRDEAARRRISSVAYADDEMQSDENTASAVGMPRRSCSSWSVSSGGPRTFRLNR